jgi:hypothetical protein
MQAGLVLLICWQQIQGRATEWDTVSSSANHSWLQRLPHLFGWFHLPEQCIARGCRCLLLAALPKKLILLDMVGALASEDRYAPRAIPIQQVVCCTPFWDDSIQNRCQEISLPTRLNSPDGGYLTPKLQEVALRTNQPTPARFRARQDFLSDRQANCID